MTDGPTGRRDFFVSFTDADRPWAMWIAWMLEAAGYSVVFQDWDFKGNFVVEMDRAHKESRRTIAVLSPDYLKSRFGTSEWTARFAQDATSEHDLLIPVRIRLCNLEGLLAQIVYEDLVGCSEEAAKQRLLARVGGLRRKPAESPIFPGAPRHEVIREKPSFPVPPHNLPQPNRAFVGRTTELEALRRALAAGGRTAITQPQAVTGLGGIGKTQLALAYAYAHLGAYDLVRWLRAEGPTALAADYAGMAPPLGLDPNAPDRTAAITAVRDKLEQADRWLLVFDNATEPGSLEAYLPRVGSGHVLVTSRWREWEGTARALELEELPEPEAVALLLGEGADDAAQRAAAAELAQELGRLPLALAQARAFMRARRVGVAAYREQLAAARPKVLAWRPPNAGYPFAVAQAWQASLDHAARDCPAARELMSLLAFLAPEAVPRDLLGAKPEVLSEGLRDPFDRDTAIEALGRFSLVHVEPDSLTVHRLVQAVTCDGLDEPSSRRCAATAVELVDAALPRQSSRWAHWPVIGRLLPHALAVAEAAERFGVGLVAAGAILNDVGAYHEEHAAWPEAEPLLRRAIAVRERALGPDHPYLAESLGCLGLFYLSTGDCAEGELLVERALAIYKRALGPEAPDLARSFKHIAMLYRRTGRPAEAEPLYERVIALRERTLGPEHPDVAYSLSDLAVLYYDTGRSAEAEPLLRRALAIRERALGPEHQFVGGTLYRLAQVYLGTGRSAEAEPLFRRCLKIIEKTKTDQDPVLVLEDYAVLLDQVGRGEEATVLREQAHMIQLRR